MERGSQGDYRRHTLRHLRGNRSGQHTAQAMPDDVNLAAGLGVGFFDGVDQMSLDEQVRTFRVDADPGTVRPIPDAPQPGAELGPIQIVQQKAGNTTTAEPSLCGTP